MYRYEVISARARSVFGENAKEEAEKKFKSLKKAVFIDTKDNTIREKGGVIAFKTLINELNLIKEETPNKERVEALIKRLKDEDIVYV